MNPYNPNNESEVEDETVLKEDNLASAPRHHNNPNDKGKFFVLRQIFNIIFMIGAVIGCVVYLKVNDMMGAILIVIAMAFKMAECVLRFKK